MSAKCDEAEGDIWVKTTCAYCGVGCGLEARPKEGQRVLEVRGDEQHPSNYGRLCSKGLALGETVGSENRLLHPMVEGERRSWPDALQFVADRFLQVLRDEGPDALAFYVSGQLLTEDYYVANKLMKGFIGSGNIDTNSRLCMSSSVAGHKRAFGSDTVPGCYEDLEQADLLVLTGSNLAWCHPVLYQRVKAAKQERPDMKVVVVDPRRTDTCELADLHLAIQPGTDVALFNGLLAYLAQQGAVDDEYVQAHTQGFTRALVSAMGEAADRSVLADRLGVDENELVAFFQWFVDTEKVVTVYSQGVNQSSSGTDKVNSIINCHLATGRIGQPGCGPFSVTGQPNAMGGREVGGLANTLAAHMEFDNPKQWRTVSEFWDSDRLASKPGLKAVDLFDAIDEGRIKAVWIMATNPVMSLPNADKVRRALKKCPLVVVSDCVADTDTARLGQVLLPALGWAEKSGTVTNSERRISRQRAILPPLGEARADWWIVSEVARRMGFVEAFDYPNAAAVFREYAALTAKDNGGSRDLDLGYYQAISANQYDQMRPRQWPVTDGDETGSQRLFGDGHFFTANGRAQFVAVEHRPPRDRVDPQYPLMLNTGRIRDQWHSMTRTGLSPRLSAHRPEPYINVHPQDAQKFRLTDKGLADVHSRRGWVRVRVHLNEECRPGQVFMPMHWTDTQSGRARVSTLIGPHCDPVSGQPESKHTPVRMVPWRPASEALLITREKIATPACDYWALQRVEGGYLYRLASHAAPQDLDLYLRGLCPRGPAQQLRFGHLQSGEFRHAVTEGGTLLAAYAVAKDFAQAGKDYEWLGQLLSPTFDEVAMAALFKGEPGEKLGRGKLVCACKQVGYDTLCSAIRERGIRSVADLSAATEAGTGCGSCVPELESILSEQSGVNAA